MISGVWQTIAMVLLSGNTLGIAIIIFKAGKFAQRVEDMDERVKRLEARCLSAIRPPCKEDGAD